MRCQLLFGSKGFEISYARKTYGETQLNCRPLRLATLLTCTVMPKGGWFLGLAYILITSFGRCGHLFVLQCLCRQVLSAMREEAIPVSYEKTPVLWLPCHLNYCPRKDDVLWEPVLCLEKVLFYFNQSGPPCDGPNSVPVWETHIWLTALQSGKTISSTAAWFVLGFHFFHLASFILARSESLLMWPAFLCNTMDKNVSLALVSNGPLWPALTLCGQLSPIWSLWFCVAILGLFGNHWPYIFSTDSVWSALTLCGQRWPCVSSIDPLWPALQLPPVWLTLPLWSLCLFPGLWEVSLFAPSTLSAVMV